MLVVMMLSGAPSNNDTNHSKSQSQVSEDLQSCDETAPEDFTEWKVVEYTDPEQDIFQEYLQDTIRAKDFNQRVAGSALKRCCTTLAGVPFKLVFSNPLMFPFKWLSQSYAGAWGKSFGAWMAQKYQHEGMRCFIPYIDKAPVVANQIVQAPIDTRSIWESTKGVVVQIGKDTKTSILNTRPVDIVEKGVGTLGSLTATGIFVMVAGPPGLLAFPALWLVEGATKNLTAELAKRWCLKYYGEAAKIRLQQVLGHDVPLLELPNDPADALTVESFEQITLETPPKAIIFSASQSANGREQINAIVINAYAGQNTVSIGEQLLIDAFNGDLEAIRTLVNAGANVNVQDEQGVTPLHNACMQDHVDVVAYLIGQGALNVADRSGLYPKDYVIPNHEHSDAIEDLLDTAFPSLSANPVKP